VAVAANVYIPVEVGSDEAFRAIKRRGCLISRAVAEFELRCGLISVVDRLHEQIVQPIGKSLEAPVAQINYPDAASARLPNVEFWVKVFTQYSYRFES
jgi:hypothetical protein